MINIITKKVYLHRRKESQNADYIYYCFDSDQSHDGYTLIAIQWVNFKVCDNGLIEKEC